MTEDTLGRFLDEGLVLTGIVSNMTGFPDDDRRIVAELAEAAVTSGDIDWAVYYMDRVVSHIAGVVGHVGVDLGERGEYLFNSTSEDGWTLIDLLNAGESTTELQAALRKWRNARGITSKPPLNDRAPLPY